MRWPISICFYCFLPLPPTLPGVIPGSSAFVIQENGREELAIHHDPCWHSPHPAAVRPEPYPLNPVPPCQIHAGALHASLLLQRPHHIASSLHGHSYGLCHTQACFWSTRSKRATFLWSQNPQTRYCSWLQRSVHSRKWASSVSANGGWWGRCWTEEWIFHLNGHPMLSGLIFQEELKFKIFVWNFLFWSCYQLA